MRIASDQSCAHKSWLNKQIPYTERDCLAAVRSLGAECDQQYFNFVTLGDQNCGCVLPGSDCTGG